MNNFLIRSMRLGTGVEPDAHIFVMGLLSVTKTIRLPPHWCPQVIAAAMMAKSSLKSMSK